MYVILLVLLFFHIIPDQRLVCFTTPCKKRYRLEAREVLLKDWVLLKWNVPIERASDVYLCSQWQTAGLQ